MLQNGSSPRYVIPRRDGQAKFQHPKLPFGQWKSVYDLWRSAGNSLPALPESKSKPKAKTSAFAPLQESVLEVKPEVAKDSPTGNQIRRRLETQELEAIFAEESWRYYKVCSGNMGDFGKFLAGKVRNSLLSVNTS